MKTWDDKSFYTLNYFLREKFQGKVSKISLDAGFTCPNRDGSISTGGCVFCSPRGSGDFCSSSKDLLEQFIEGKEKMGQKWKTNKHIGYFQAYTNTYDTVENLRKYYEIILEQDDVVGLAIATRPDCLSNEVLDLIEELSHKKYIWVELGLQTIHEETAIKINRGYDLAVYDKAVENLRKRKIDVVTHIIFGLPDETQAMMLETIEHIAHNNTQGVKIHLLHIMKNTPLHIMYIEGKVKPMELEAYVDVVAKSLERIPDNMVIHRLTGDAPRQTLVAPMWSLKKFEVLNAIDILMKSRNTWQGKKMFT